MERIVHVRGAWDLRRPNPHENYGVHGMEISFYIKGDKGAVNMTLQTQWYVPGVFGDEYIYSHMHYPFRGAEEFLLPNIIDIGYHSKVPHYEGHTHLSDCKLTGGDCYYDGTSLWGNEQWREGFIHGGTEWLWPRLEQLYLHYFENGAAPNLTPIPRKHPKEA